jgi:hypothetical protein
MVLLELAPMELVWLLGEARSRQRRRRRRLAWGVLAVLACTILIRAAIAGPGPTGAGGETRTSIPTVAPSTVFAKAPYMGVHCPRANSIACDRVGLAIWLRRPAVRVRGTIAGQPVVLDWFGDEHRVGPQPARRDLDGYLQPAHIVARLGVHPDPHGRWYGSQTGTWPAPLVRLTITFADGHRVATQMHVALSTGWG